MDSLQLTVILDFSKAFDTVYLDIFIAKLRNLGFSSSFRLFFESHLKGRQSRVELGDSISDLVETLQGVPQGSNLGPLLFSIYISSFLKNNECRLHHDLLIYLHWRGDLENLALMSQIASNWGLLLNPAETQ